MKKYAQIVNNKVHGIFEYNVLPEFDSSIVMVDITNLSTPPKIGDVYDGTSFTTPASVVIPLAEQKKAKIKALQEKYQAEYDAYLAQYPKSEIATFEDKKKEAIAYNLDNTTPTPIIDSILAGYGSNITKDDYVASILAKVNYLAQREGAMVAKRDAIKACTTQAELDAIVI